MSEVRKEARELAAQCWCDPKTSHIEMNADLVEAMAYRIDRLLSQIADLRTEVARSHTARSDTGHELVALTLLLENKLGECRKQLAEAKLQLTEARAELESARSFMKQY